MLHAAFPLLIAWITSCLKDVVKNLNYNHRLCFSQIRKLNIIVQFQGKLKNSIGCQWKEKTRYNLYTPRTFKQLKFRHSC